MNVKLFFFAKGQWFFLNLFITNIKPKKYQTKVSSKIYLRLPHTIMQIWFLLENVANMEQIENCSTKFNELDTKLFFLYLKLVMHK